MRSSSVRFVVSVMLLAVAVLTVTVCGGGQRGGGGGVTPVESVVSHSPPGDVGRGALLYDEGCVECHGWDYHGVHAHGMGAPHDSFADLPAADVRDLAAFVKSGIEDTTPWIDPATRSPRGDAVAGAPLYAAHCAECHGADGVAFELPGGMGVAEAVRADPWRVLHAIRWGKPGTTMPSMVAVGLTPPQQADLLAHALALRPPTPSAAPSPPPPPSPSPATLSFARDVYPVFTARKCTTCHGTSGGMTLSGGPAAAHAALTGKPGRVDLANPANSLLLRKPSLCGVAHGGRKVFQSPSDPDYQRLLAWIVAGARND